MDERCKLTIEQKRRIIMIPEDAEDKEKQYEMKGFLSYVTPSTAL